MRFVIKLMLLFVLIAWPIAFAIDLEKDTIGDTVNKLPSDSDNDGMPDRWEIINGLRYDVVDSMVDNDNDGLSNLEEFLKGTDPNSADSDGDSINDYKEVEDGTDPLSEDIILWPFIILLVLMVASIFILILSHKYKIDIALKEKFSKFFSKKGKIETVKKSWSYEEPKIFFRSFSQIKNEREQQKQKLMKTFDVNNVQKKDRVLNRKSIIPQQKINSIVPEINNKPKNFSDNQNPSVFERLKHLR